MFETDSQHVLACKRVRASKVWDRLPHYYITTLEQNQLIASCCRHPENHDVEAWFSSPKDAERGVPDIYKFHCTTPAIHHEWAPDSGAALKLKSGMKLLRTDGLVCRICKRITTVGEWKNVPDDCETHACGRVQPRFCVGEGDEHLRPVWGARPWRLRVAIRAFVERLMAGNARPFWNIR